MHAPEMPRDPVEELAEEFLERYRKGERPPLTEFTERRPDLASAILRLFPTLAMMEEMGLCTVAKADASPDAGASDGKPPDRIGDYRIVRELGRGGMGVVYEAEHLTLGRQVALKVLPFQSAKDETRLKRFWREARAVARLHHTNIVPVFEVGEFGGIYFYAMQLIRGQALDVLLSALRCAAQTSLEPAAGHRQVEQTVTAISAAESPAIPQAAISYTPPPAPGRHYREVARLGLQVAEALAHAHDHKILHRDIKPANLLVDHDGTVWVTDFGLAKEEGDTLTRTGDVVGTLRYMAPERFNGMADGRSDVYSLGLTLYEYATLRPAFEESDRGRLIQRVAREEPLRPRQLDRHIPRDLETIILKASAKEPERRYRTAVELAEDLQRFLADRPIRARRASVLEQTWRWTRRNPIVASLTAFAATLLVLVAVITTVAAIRLDRAQGMIKQELYRALVAQAQASRSSGRPGQQFESLEALRTANALAADLDLPADARLERRNAVISALAVPDLHAVRPFEANVPPQGGVGFDARLEHYARSDARGNISVRRVADDLQIIRLPGRGFGAPVLRFSPNGRLLAAKYYTGDKEQPVEYRVWDWRTGKSVVHQESDAFGEALDFTPNSKQIIIGGRKNGVLRFYELPSGKKTREFQLGYEPRKVAFDPAGKRLAVCSEYTHDVQVLDPVTGQLILRPFQGADWFDQVVWRSDGEVLAALCGDKRIYTWEVRTGRRQSLLTGHTAPIQEIAFSHRGDLLVSSGWDATLRLWDPMTGRQLLTAPPARAFQFSLDDRQLAQIHSGQPGLWQVARGSACRCLYGHEVGSDEAPACVDFSPGGGLLASGRDNGVCLWDTRTGQATGYLPIGAVQSILFQADGACFLTSGRVGLLRWPVRSWSGEGEKRIRIGPPQFLLSGPLEHLGWNRRGPRVAVVRKSTPRALLFVDLRAPTRSPRVFTYPSGVGSCVMSTDGKWVVTGNWKGRDARIWDPADGRLLRTLSIPTHVGAIFSPDSKMLLTAADNEYQFWTVGSWEPGPLIRTENMEGSACPGEFSPNGRTLAIVDSAHSIRLFDARTHQELATLTPPDGQQIGAMCWSPDASQLATTATSQTIHLWDVRGIRRELAALKLDWDPPLEPPAKPQPIEPIQIEIDLGNATSRRRLSQALDWKGRVRLWSAIVASEPRNGHAYLQRAWTFADLGQIEPAESDYQQSRALLPATDPAFREPENAAFANTVAWYLVTCQPERRAPTRALPLAQVAVKLVPDEPNYWNTLGLVLYRLDRYPEAVTALKRSLGDGKRDGAVYDRLFLGMCYQRLGQTARAHAYNDEAIRWLESHPHSAWIPELNAFKAETAALLHVPDAAANDGPRQP